jgi:hypothetical protein
MTSNSPGSDVKAKSPDSLEAVIRDAGEDWLIDWFSPRSGAVAALQQRLQQVSQESRKRFGENGPNFDDAALVAEFKRAPQIVRAFLQALGESDSPDMLLMVWRILQGMEVREIELAYRLQEHFHLRVTLVSPYEEPPEHYESDDIDDAALLRHLGIMKMDGQPVFDGFYAIRR